MHGTHIAIPFLHALQLHLARKRSGSGLLEPRARSFWAPDEVGPDWPIFEVAPSTVEEEQAIEGAGLQHAALDMAQSLLPHLPDNVQAVGTPALKALKLVLDAHAGSGGKYGGGWWSDAWSTVKNVAKEVQHNDAVKAIEKKAVGWAERAGTKALQGVADGALAETGVGEAFAPMANKLISAGTHKLAQYADDAIDGSGLYRPGEGDAGHLRPHSHHILNRLPGHTRPFHFRRVA